MNGTIPIIKDDSLSWATQHKNRLSVCTDALLTKMQTFFFYVVDGLCHLFPHQLVPVSVQDALVGKHWFERDLTVGHTALTYVTSKFH